MFRLSRVRRGVKTLAIAGAATLLAIAPCSADIGGVPSRVHALVGALVVAAPDLDAAPATIVIRDGRIEALGPDVHVPEDARVWDCRGRVVYPGFVEPYLRLGPPEGEFPREGAVSPHPAVRADVRAVDRLPLPPERTRELREAGYTVAFLAPTEGVFRGRGAVVSLVDDAPRDHVLETELAQVVAFEHAKWPERDHPNSLMGAIALIRQTLLDAAWKRRADLAWRSGTPGADPVPADLSLDALGSVLERRSWPVIECEDLRMIERAVVLCREAKLAPVIVAGGTDAYKRPAWLAGALKSVGARLVVSLDTPHSPFWRYEEQKVDVDIDDLVHWELAPTSPARAVEAGIALAVSGVGLEKPDGVLEALRNAVDHGFSPERALAALTTNAASVLGLESRIGTIAPGKRANLTLASGPLLESTTRIAEVWIDGERFAETLTRAAPKGLAGRWALRTGAHAESLVVVVELAADADTLSGHVIEGDSTLAELTGVELERRTLSLTLPASVPRASGARFEGLLAGDRVIGSLGRAGVPCVALSMGEPDTTGGSPGDSLLAEGASAWPPVLAPHSPEALHVRNATVWTAAEAGVLERADVVLEDGRVRAVGFDLKTPGNAAVIDGEGLHVTPGIVDCHSHSIAAGGTNESTQNATCEVRIRDVLDPWSRHIYLQLAGGVTTVQVLHGSANPIGGQSAVVKYRWGEMAGGLLLDDAPPGVKFALGENVKQSNWGDGFTTRYPQTRMGVEPFLRERFLAALDHRRELERWAAGPEGTPPKPDLELDALIEILEGTRRIHCHAYRQDEMLMLMRLAESFGITVGTFQHGLEGYKIADEIAAHGAGASIFSDWWGYKFEVYDAIPYAGAILHERGVLVSYNSDDGHVARRLNLEAAKAVKWGDVTEEDALAFVTRNPAIQLGLDRRVGAIEPGMDGDLAIWSDHPLSDQAVCLETWIDGRRYFSREADLAARSGVEALREALIAKAAKANDRTEAARRKPTFGATYGGGGDEVAAHERGVCAGRADGEVE